MGSVCIERRNLFFFSVLWQLTFPLLLSSNRISEFDELRWLWLCCTLFVFFLFPSFPRELDYLSSEITLQKYLNYFAEYITLFYFIWLIESLWFELLIVENLQFAQPLATLQLHSHTSLISFSLFSPFFLSFVLRTTFALFLLLFSPQRTTAGAWRQKLALFFLDVVCGGRRNHVHLIFLCWEKQGLTKTMTGRTGENNTQSIRRSCHADSGTRLFGGLAFPKAHLELADKIVHVFF